MPAADHPAWRTRPSPQPAFRADHEEARIMIKPTHLGRLLLLTAALAACGCESPGFIWEHEERDDVDLGVATEDDDGMNSPARRDTIGSITYYEGMGPMRVRGYGLVVGLGTKGSRDCPSHIYKALVQAMYKQHSFASSEIGVKSTTPEQLINSLDSAVVAVYGEIPAASVKGAPFDVVVRALPNTQTESLRGGRLFPTDLEIFKETGSGGSITGQALARAIGSVFVNPFSDKESATKTDPRKGMILGGGRAIKDRRIRLVLVKPSYQLARRIQDRINSQFPGQKKVADAISPSFIQLHPPLEYFDNTGHFLALVRALYLSNDPRFGALRARELKKELLRPDAKHGEISLCMEGLGRNALPLLKDLYAHPKDYVNFHAAVAGMRLGDHLACDVIAMHAKDPNSKYRFPAIRAAAEPKGMAGAATVLRHLLSDEDPRVQIAAYEALITRRDRSIDATPIGADNFVLHRVHNSPTNFVYAKRSKTRRIVLFGDAMQCSSPVFYKAPDGCVTISAHEGDAALTVLRHMATTGRSSPPVPAPTNVAQLIMLLGGEAGISHDKRVTGLGLDYGSIVGALHDLCNDQSINAKFMLEQPNIADLFGPLRPAGRPESEL